MFVAWFAGSVGAPVSVGYVAPASAPLDRSIASVALAPGAPPALGEALAASGRFTVVDDPADADAIVAWGPDGGRVVAADGQVVDEAPLADVPTVDAYAARIAPHPVRADRFLYRKGGDGIVDGCARADAGDWDGAVAAWLDVVRTGSERQVAFARHDLAVAAERAGRLDRALQLSRNAADAIRRDLTDDYVAALEARWVDARALASQLRDGEVASRR